jgi:quaternary ammonium compound-resistance protein SugE
LAWFILFFAGLTEIAWAIRLKYTHALSHLWPGPGTLAAMLANSLLLFRALVTLPVGTAYAAWTGIGGVGAAILGILPFREPALAACLLCIGLTVTGIPGLSFVAGWPAGGGHP